VIKPAVSVGAIGLSRAPTRSPEAARRLAELLDTGDALLQPFDSSVVEHGELSLVFFGGKFSHAVRKRPATGDFRVHLAYGGSVAPSEVTPRQLAAAVAAISAAPEPTAYGRVDLIGTAEAPVVMELELIDPELFLGFDAGAPRRLAELLVSLLG
jgi:glutathione synthase/RimK-type ligase-like ATP-grasp enzyme